MLIVTENYFLDNLKRYIIKMIVHVIHGLIWSDWMGLVWTEAPLPIGFPSRNIAQQHRDKRVLTIIMQVCMRVCACACVRHFLGDVLALQVVVGATEGLVAPDHVLLVLASRATALFSLLIEQALHLHRLLYTPVSPWQRQRERERGERERERESSITTRSLCCFFRLFFRTWSWHTTGGHCLLAHKRGRRTCNPSLHSCSVCWCCRQRGDRIPAQHRYNCKKQVKRVLE